MSGTVSITWEPRLRAHLARCVCGWHITDTDLFAAVMEMVSSPYYDRRRETATRATQRNLRDAAEMHRRVYQAIRAGDAPAARAAMNEHLAQSSSHQALEAETGNQTSSGILGAPNRAARRPRPRRQKP